MGLTKTFEAAWEGVEDLLCSSRHCFVEGQRSSALSLPLIRSNEEKDREARHPDHEHVHLGAIQ